MVWAFPLSGARLVSPSMPMSVCDRADQGRISNAAMGRDGGDTRAFVDGARLGCRTGGILDSSASHLLSRRLF